MSFLKWGILSVSTLLAFFSSSSFLREDLQLLLTITVLQYWVSACCKCNFVYQYDDI